MTCPIHFTDTAEIYGLFQQELCSLPDSTPPWGKPPIPGQQLTATARAEVSHVVLSSFPWAAGVQMLRTQDE